MNGGTVMQDRPLIVGAGPTGLTAALFLALKGIQARLIDQAEAPELQSRALAVNPRTLELLSATGVADAIRADSHRMRRVRFHRDWQPVAELEFDARSRCMLVLPQARTEALLREALARLGVEPERGARFEGLMQDADGVVATLSHGEGKGRETARAPVLLGADGAHSRVRAALGIAFEGSVFPEEWPLCDIHLDDPLDLDSAHVNFIEDGLIFMLGLSPGLWRVFGNVPDILDHLPPGSHPGAAEWRSSFHVSHRLAARENCGRVALAGDAAHLHSPVGARGMKSRHRGRLCLRRMRRGRARRTTGPPRRLRPPAPRGPPRGGWAGEGAYAIRAWAPRSPGGAAALSRSRHDPVSPSRQRHARHAHRARPRGEGSLTGLRARNPEKC